MTSDTSSLRLVLEPADPRRLATLAGRLNEHLRQIEDSLGVKIMNRSNVFTLSGANDSTARGAALLRNLYQQAAENEQLGPDDVHLAIRESMDGRWLEERDNSERSGHRAEYEFQVLRTPKLSVKPRGRHQNEYINRIMRHDINFGIGPAGTGKTYLAVACAVEALTKERVQRILLVRPAVEAGEKLGFLPGDLSQKVDPYLRPLYDALYDMLGFERVAKLIERNVIEVAPLAYMRGRTLNNSYVILDESQNTTTSQMKMFLTRIGFGSTAVITGDISQIDLPRGTRSGLVQVSKVLKGIDGISFTWFDSADVVRHPIVQKVVEAYDAWEEQQTLSSLNKKDGDQRNERDS